MKSVVLIGASGFVGNAILNELLSRGHKVTAVVRNPKKINVTNSKLEIVKTDVSDTNVMVEICKGKEAIISAYNPGWANPDIYEETLRNYPLILEAAKRSGAKRLLCVGGAGTLFCAPGLRVVNSGAIPDAIMDGVKSLGEFYLNTLMNEKTIDWIFFSPAGTLESGKRTGKFRLGKDDLIVDENGIRQYPEDTSPQIRNPSESIIANHTITGHPGLYAKEETRFKGLKI